MSAPASPSVLEKETLKMTGMKKRLMHLGFVVVALCALSAAVALAAADSPAQPKAPAGSAEGAIARMRTLTKDNKWQELVDQFKDEDLSTWPDAGEAFHLRGYSYLHLKDGAKAERDLKAAVERVPENGYFWHSLGDTYQQLLRDDARALDAYRKGFELEDKYVWVTTAATLKAANILLYQVKNDAALETLNRYGEEDLKKLSPYYRISILRAYGEVYAAQGRDAEAWAKFDEALKVERGQ